MADQLKLRGGSEDASKNFTGAAREVTVDTTDWTLRVHDGVTAGGHKLLKSGSCLVVEEADKCDPTKPTCEVTVNGDLNVEGNTNLHDTVIDGNLIVNGDFEQSGITIAVDTSEVALINKGPFTGDCNVPSSFNLSTQLDLNIWVTAAIKILDTELCALKAIVDGFDDRIDQNETDIAVLKESIKNIEENINDLQKLVADLELEVEKNQDNITDNSVAIGKLEVEVNNIKQEIEDLKQDIGKIEVNDGVLTINNSDGTLAGQFSANQLTNTTVVLPKGFTGSYDDLTDKPTEFPPENHTHSYNDLTDKPDINDGALIINNSDGSPAGKFTANQSGDSTIVLPEGFSGSWNDLTDKPTEFPPAAHEHALDDLSDVNVAGAADGQQLVFRGSEWVAEDNAFVNQAVHFKGFIDVGTDTAPAAAPGDTYIQHRADEADAVAGSSWTGIVGETTQEGQYVIWGADNQWHKGKTVENVAQVQSDWLVSDTSSAAYIANKPDIQNLIDNSLPTVNDGTLTIKDSSGTTVGTFTANQAGSTDVTLPQGFSGNWSDLNGVPSEFPPSNHSHSYNDLTDKPTIGDGTLTIKNSDGSTAGTFKANQTTSTDISLPAGFSGSWNDLSDKPSTFPPDSHTHSYNDLTDKPTIPTVNNGKLELKDASGAVSATFTANQAGNSEATVYIKDNYIQHLPSL